MRRMLIYEYHLVFMLYHPIAAKKLADYFILRKIDHLLHRIDHSGFRLDRFRLHKGSSFLCSITVRLLLAVAAFICTCSIVIEGFNAGII